MLAVSRLVPVSANGGAVKILSSWFVSGLLRICYRIRCRKTRSLRGFGDRIDVQTLRRSNILNLERCGQSVAKLSV